MVKIPIWVCDFTSAVIRNTIKTFLSNFEEKWSIPYKYKFKVWCTGRRNTFKIQPKLITLIKSHWTWIQCLLATFSTTSNENPLTNSFWSTEFSVFWSAPVHCLPAGTHNQFHTGTCQQSVLSHLGDFKPKPLSKLNILNPQGGMVKQQQKSLGSM